MSCSNCLRIRSYVWRGLWLAALAGASLYLAAAERLPAPAAAAASALRSVLGEAAKPAVQAASAVKEAVKTTPKPADVAASAVKAVLVPLLPASAPPSVAAASAPASVPTSPAPSVAACLRTSDLVASCQPGLQLSLSPIALPTARMGLAYKTRRLVNGGNAPYRFEVVDGSKPEGLDFTADGALAGKAIGPVRPYSFTVQVADASSPALTVRQAYTLRVEPPPVPKPPAPASAPASAPAVVAAPAPAPRLPQVTSYMLLQEDLDDMFPKPKAPAPAASDAADGVSPPAPAASEPRRRVRPRHDGPPPPYAEKMQAMLAPMLNIDYPTARLFASALEARRCTYYAQQLAEATKTAVMANELRCPSADGNAPPHPGNALLPPTLFADLLPAAVKRDLVARAEWPHLFSEAAPVSWTDNGCGCVPPLTDELVYGFYPFWEARPKEEQQIQFNLFNRIGYLGAQITDTGEIVTATSLTPQSAGFASHARRFGTKVDLVIHRAEWARFLALPDGEVIVDRAVRDTVALVDAPYTDFSTRLKNFLLPFWDQPVHTFDGVTLFFDNAPTDAAGKEKFRAFYRSFVHKLIAAMQKTQRPYMLGIVVPDHEIGEDGAYGFEQLMDYLRLAQRPDSHRLPDGAETTDYIGTTDITVNFLVLMHEPTGAAKKALRARIDNTEVIQGHRRVAFLNAVSPVIFHSGGEPKAPIESVDKPRLDLDLAYFKWQYGGAAVWPMPEADTVNGQAINAALAHNYGFASAAGSLGAACDFVCPHRTGVRLLFMGLLLAQALALGLYVWVCAVRRFGRPYIAGLWLCGVLALAVGLALLSCDPQLEHLRRGNALLIALLAITVAGGMYYSLRPRIAPP